MIALNKFLTQETASPLIKERIPQILDVLVSYLKYVKYIEEKTALKAHKNKVIDDEDSDEEEAEEISDKDILASLLDNTNVNMVFNANNDDDDDDEEDYGYDEDDSDDDDDDYDEEAEEELYFPSPKVKYLS